MDLADRLELADVFGTEEALAYINERLPESERLSLPGFKRHIFDDPNREGTLFQLEPLALGGRVYADGDRASVLVFTRRMLDDYIANRPANARRRAERAVTRPTEHERAVLLGWPDVQTRLNNWFAARRLPFRISESAMSSYRVNGRIPFRRVGQSAVYLARDVDAFAHEFTRHWRGRLRAQAGRPPKGRRSPRREVG
jgi:hypothetical protein